MAEAHASNKQAMEERTKDFAVRVLTLIDHLPNSVAGRVVANQLARSATSVGANYRAACRGRSRAEFAAKLGTVAEEADESLYWLELIAARKLVPLNKVNLLLREADELTAIFTAGRHTAVSTSNLKLQTSNIR